MIFVTVPTGTGGVLKHTRLVPQFSATSAIVGVVPCAVSHTRQRSKHDNLRNAPKPAMHPLFSVPFGRYCRLKLFGTGYALKVSTADVPPRSQKMSITYSHVASPVDPRCPWMQLIASPEEVLTSKVEKTNGATTLPGKKQKKNADSELPGWTIVFDIEANSRTKNRGWTHTLGVVRGEEIHWIRCTAIVKETIKADRAACDADPDLLLGSGPNAAMLRAAKWILSASTDEGRAERLKALF